VPLVGSGMLCVNENARMALLEILVAMKMIITSNYFVMNGTALQVSFYVVSKLLHAEIEFCFCVIKQIFPS